MVSMRNKKKISNTPSYLELWTPFTKAFLTQHTRAHENKNASCCHQLIHCILACDEKSVIAYTCEDNVFSYGLDSKPSSSLPVCFFFLDFPADLTPVSSLSLLILLFIAHLSHIFLLTQLVCKVSWEFHKRQGQSIFRS